MSGSRRQLAVAAIALAMALAGCSSSGTEQRNLPSGSTLLRRAAVAMRDVRTAHFSLDATGRISGLGIRRAEGVLTREGDASGTVDLDQGGQLVEFEFVISGPTFYVKGPTGGFQTVPRFLATGFYDPTKLLDPEVGVAKLLSTAKGGRTLAEEAVAGAAAYRLEATIDGSILATLLPLSQREGSIPATLWVGKDSPRLLRAKISIKTSGEVQASTLTVDLSEFNAPVQVSPPSG